MTAQTKTILGVAAALAALFGGAAIAGASHQTGAPAAACTQSTSACAEWVPLGSGGARSMIYRTWPLKVRNPRIRRALVMVHGTLRNPDHYFTTATGAAFLAKALDDTVVIAPAIRSAEGSCKDRLEAGEVSWSCGGDSWRSGGASPARPELTSFDFMDAIVRELADRRTFPNLQVVVIAGHSAGGQFVSRYQMANRVDGTVGVPIRYVVANPSTYAWPVSERPLPLDDAAPEAAVKGWQSEEPHVRFRYGAFDAAKAADYDQWPYGLEDRKGGYTKGMTDAQLTAQLAGRPATYLLGQVDTLPLGGFDGSPGAMAQGATRRARGEAFVHYLDERLGGHATAMIVPECGHNDRCVFTTDVVLPVIFPAVAPVSPGR